MTLGTGNQFLGLIYRNNSFMLQGLCKEASHYLFGLFVSSLVLYLMYDRYHEKKAALWGGLLCFIVVNATSLSALMYFFFFIVFVVFYESNKLNTPQKRINSLIKRIILGFIIALVGILALLFLSDNSSSYTLQRIHTLPSTIKALFYNMNFSYIGANYSSELIRFYSIISTLKNLTHRLLFGYGIGTTICHGSTLQFLSDVGIVGMYFWYKNYLNFGDTQNGFYKMAMGIYILSNIFSSMYLVHYVGTTPCIVMVVLDIMFKKSREERYE